MSHLFDVYPLYDLELTKGSGCYVYDKQGREYLDFYGGHAVISIGHAHPNFVRMVGEQLATLPFYSNSVINPLQEEFATQLKTVSGCEDYQLFYCSSGAEANENALKLASFVTGKKRIVSYAKGFHGRTSGAVAVTDNANIKAPFNQDHQYEVLPWMDLEATRTALQQGDVAGVIIEGIQGIGGIHVPSAEFLKSLRSLCDEYGAKLILDEVQSGAGRTGKFFAFQHAGISPDIITLAKGIGNGFPLGVVFIREDIPAKHGMLGTTFGGNHLSMAAGLSVVQTIKEEGLMKNAAEMGAYLMQQFEGKPYLKEVRGKGLMIGLEFNQEIASIRKQLLFDEQIFTGVSGKFIIRLLPPLNITKSMADRVVTAIDKVSIARTVS